MKINISFITLTIFADFVQLFLFNTSISVFFFLSKVSVLAHFQESMRWLFPIQTFISLVIRFPFKWPRKEARTKQQQNKTTFTSTRSQGCYPTNCCQPMKLFWRIVTGTLHWLARLHYLLYFLAFDWLRPAVVLFLKCTVCLLSKGKPYLKLSKLILNWTVRKN